MMEENSYSYQVPVRRAIVNNRDPLGRLSLYFPDSGAGGSVMPPPILGGATTGFHTMPNIADEVAIFHEWPNRPFACISVVEKNQLSLLPTLAPGESVTIAADKRQVGYLKSDGSTLLYNKPSGTAITVAASGNVSIVTPAAGSIVLNAGVGGTIVATGITTLNQSLTVTGVTTLSGNVQQAVASPAWTISAAGAAAFAGTLSGLPAPLKIGASQMQGQLDMNSFGIITVPTIASSSTLGITATGQMSLTSSGGVSFSCLSSFFGVSAATNVTLVSGTSMTLQAYGSSTISLSTGGTVAITNAATIGGTLGVTGLSSLAALNISGTLTASGTSNLNGTTNLNGGSTVFAGVFSSNSGTAFVRIDQSGNTTLAGTINTGSINAAGSINLSGNSLNGLASMNGNSAITFTSTGGGNITLSTGGSVNVTNSMNIGGSLNGLGHALNLGGVAMSGQLDMGNSSIVNVFQIIGSAGGGGFLRLDLSNQTLNFNNAVTGGSRGGSTDSLKVSVNGATYYIPCFT